MSKKKKAAETIIPTNDTNNYSVAAILEVNKILGIPTMLWGRSGTGKSSHLNQYAIDNGMDVILIEGISINPSLSAIPKITEDRVRILLTDWLAKACEATRPTLLFIDEFNRVESNMAFNLLTNVLLARQYQGHKISPHVQIVAACNYEEEDNGVRDLPDALYKRIMHLEWAPNLKSIISYMPIPQEYKEALLMSDACIDMSFTPYFKESVISKLNNNPRQTSRAINFYSMSKEKGLNESQIFSGMLGMIGESVHIILPLISQVNEKIPDFNNKNFFDKCDDLYKKGKGQELISTFQLRAESDPETTAKAILILGIPEIITALKPQLEKVSLRGYLEMNGQCIFINPEVNVKGCLKRQKQTPEIIEKYSVYKDSPASYNTWVFLLTQLVFDENAGKFITKSG